MPLPSEIDRYTITPSTTDDPEVHARDAVETLRAADAGRPDVEAAILAAGQEHSDFLRRQGMSTEDWR